MDTLVLEKFKVDIISDPFDFLIKSYLNLINSTEYETSSDIYEVYLPLYSYKTKAVEAKSGLNAWNSSSKTKGSNRERPLNEIYIPIPREFHRKYPDFFTHNIFKYEEDRKQLFDSNNITPELRFNLKLPNGNVIPAVVTQSNMKALQSGGRLIDNDVNYRYGQSALGQWLLLDVLGLKERKLVTLDWLQKKGTDSVRLWRMKNDMNNINIDFAPIGSFEAFMNNMALPDFNDL
jgi:hypothetical protein